MLGASPSLPLIHTIAHDPSEDGNINTVAVSRHNSNTRVEVMANHQRHLATACTAILLILLEHYHQLTGGVGQLAIHAVIVSLGSDTAAGAGVNSHCRSNTHLSSRKRRARSHRLDRATTINNIIITTIWCRGGKMGVKGGLKGVEIDISGSRRERRKV